MVAQQDREIVVVACVREHQDGLGVHQGVPSCGGLVEAWSVNLILRDTVESGHGHTICSLSNSVLDSLLLLGVLYPSPVVLGVEEGRGTSRSRHVAGVQWKCMRSCINWIIPRRYRHGTGKRDWV